MDHFRTSLIYTKRATLGEQGVCVGQGLEMLVNVILLTPRAIGWNNQPSALGLRIPSGGVSGIMRSAV